MIAPPEFASIMTPQLVVDVPRLRRNVAHVAADLSTIGISLRPHFKTSKSLEVARLQRAAGAHGFTAATPSEAAVLLAGGMDTVLLAHQPVGPAKVGFVVDHAAEGLLVALDSVPVAGPLAQQAVAAGRTVDFLLEVNTGHARAGVDPEDAARVAAELTVLPGVRLRGVMTHEGHLATHGSDRAALEAAGRAAAALLVEVSRELRDAGHDMSIVSTGSTPGLTSAARMAGLTEARPGTYVYFDANQVRLGSATLAECALTVLARVVSVERSGTAIIDAGLKAMSSDALTPDNGAGLVCAPTGEPLPDVTFPAANEEHGFLTGDGTRDLRVGDLVRVVPNHACGTVNMWSNALAADDTSTSRWQILARH